MKATGEIGRSILSDTEFRQFEAAEELFPGGALGGNSLASDARFVFKNGKGSRFWDSSENEYIDYVLGSGTFFLGHAHPVLQKSITEQLSRGTHFFAYLNEQALEFAKRLKPLIRCAERLRFTTSGSDSTFHAMRLARAFTGRDKIIKFEGAYHGVHDYAQISTTPKTPLDFPLGTPDTAGVPEAVRDLAMIVPYNDPMALEDIVKSHKDEIAAVIIEPIQRIIMPQDNFLQKVREICTRYNVIMILDEVVTGFRYGLGGAQEYFDIIPDLASYGKIIGGGLPVGMVAGRADIMDQANPSNKGKPGYVYQNGTLQGHMLGCVAGLATLDVLSTPEIYQKTFDRAQRLRDGLQKVFTDQNMGILVFGEGPMWHMLFTNEEPKNRRDVLAANSIKLGKMEPELLRQGLFVLPGNRRFISIQHTDDDLEATFEAAKRACKVLKK
ncbi:MAG: aspartate aminotransferase family protein [Magnetovibrio sp.]|nr:aspartate aminotransferase family protein [Magnetovibrio sp.]